jgi:N,N-dimethylformamidase
MLGLDPTAYPRQAQDKYIVANRLHSHYDYHSDGSGVSLSSRLRPILNMRPKYVMPALDMGRGAPHQLNADLHLVDWMEAKGHKYDVITDEDLHFEGADLLSPYKVIVTGSHPEYWSEQMLDALEAYLANGGRIMYLGGNGFYWVTSFHPEAPHMAEVRRWRGSQAWQAAPGEYYQSTTGELGGLWRFRGRAPQRLLGVGFTAQGIDRNAPYTRQPDSFDPRAKFIFEGIGKDEKVGDFPSLVQQHGAGGFELDRLDFELGTPPHALLLATSRGYSDNVPACHRGGARLRRQAGRQHTPAGQVGHRLFRGTEGRRRLLRRLHQLVWLAVLQQL